MKTQEFSRLERVAASIKRALGQPLNNVARELNIGLLTLTAVEVAPDLRRATAFVSPLADDVDEAALLEGLNERAGELQRLFDNNAKVGARFFKYLSVALQKRLVDTAVAQQKPASPLSVGADGELPGRCSPHAFYADVGR